jgi:hypothetical protein
MDMDRCSASIQAGEKRRIDVLPKAATARRQKLAGNDIRGQDNDDIPTAPVSQRQVEFNRQMEAVLFNIPPERLERNENTVPSSTDGARSEHSTTLSFSTPQYPTSLVYSSIPELLEEAKECEDPLRLNLFCRLDPVMAVQVVVPQSVCAIVDEYLLHLIMTFFMYFNNRACHLVVVQVAMAMVIRFVEDSRRILFKCWRLQDLSMITT